MQYSTQDVSCEAVQWTPSKNHREMFDFLTGTEGRFMTCRGAHFDITFSSENEGPELTIFTAEGPVKAAPGDYIVKVACGFCPCKAAIFEAAFVPDCSMKL